MIQVLPHPPPPASSTPPLPYRAACKPFAIRERDHGRDDKARRDLMLASKTPVDYLMIVYRSRVVQSLTPPPPVDGDIPYGAVVVPLKCRLPAILL